MYYLKNMKKIVFNFNYKNVVLKNIFQMNVFLRGSHSKTKFSNSFGYRVAAHCNIERS